MKRQLAKKIDKFKLGGTPNLNTVYINNLTKMLNNAVGNNQLSQAEYGMDMQFGDPTKPKKPQVTKPVQPYYTSDRKDYDYHVKEHDDSMKLYLENAIYQKSRNNQLEAYIDWSKKNNIYPKNTTGIVIDNKSKTIPVNWNTFNYTPLQNNLNQANQFNVVNKNIKPVKVGRTYVKDSKGNVAITDKHKTPLIVEYPIYKKPVQEVIFRANNNTIKKTLTPIPTKVKYVNKKKTITNVNAVPEDKVIPQDEITPLDPMSFPQVARPEQQIIPAPPYVKPVHYAGPRHGTWSDGSTGQFPEGLNTSDWERKTLEYQQQQRGTQPVVQTRKEGGEPDKTLPDEEWYKKYQQQKAKYESDKAKGIISSTGYQDEVTVTPANNNKPQFASKQLQKPGWQQAMDQSSLKVRNNNPDNFGPQSAGSADWFWTLPFAAPAAIEAAGAIGAMSLPFMSTVPGATVGNAAMAAGMANSFYKAPQNVRDWYDVSQGTKDWKEAAAGTGEIALGLIGSKAGFKSVADDVAQGAKTVSKSVGNTYDNIAEGDNFLNYAWQSPAAKIDRLASATDKMPMSQNIFDKIKSNANLTSEEKLFVKDYEISSSAYTGRSNYPVDPIKKAKLDEIIKKSNITLDEPAVISRRINSENKDLFHLENGVYTPNRITSWSGGRDQIGNIKYSGSADRLVVKLPKGEHNILKNPYTPLTEEEILAYEKMQRDAGNSFDPLLLGDRSVERELMLGENTQFKKMGKVKNLFGGHDFIMKPKWHLQPATIEGGFKNGGDVDIKPWLYTYNQEPNAQMIGGGFNYEHGSGLHGGANLELPFNNRISQGNSSQNIGFGKKYQNFYGDATFNNSMNVESKFNPSLSTSLNYEKNLGDHYNLSAGIKNNMMPKNLFNPMINASIKYNFKQGGDIESWEDDLDDEQIKAYRKAGYIVKVIK